MTGRAAPRVSRSVSPLPVELSCSHRRRRLTGIFAASFLALNSLACAGVAPDPVQPLEQDFAITVGASVRIGQTDLVVHFDRVVNDSRCPSDGQCVTAGDATVVVTAASRGAAALRYELHTDDGAREAVHREFRIWLISLKPVPTSIRPVQPNEYVVTLRVSRP